MAAIRGERLAARIDELGLSREDVSKRVFGNRDSVRHIISGRQRDVRSENSKRLAVAVQTSEDYLFGRTDEFGEPPTGITLPPPKTSRRRPPKAARPLQQGSFSVSTSVAATTVAVPEYDVQLSAGGGALITEEAPRAEWGLPRSFLDTMRLDARQMAIVSIVGESMEPLLRDGDLVMLDLRSRNPALPGIYALWEGNATVCKRVEIVHGSDPPKLRVMSVNPAYSTYEVLAEETNIIGRVAWFGRRT